MGEGDDEGGGREEEWSMKAQGGGRGGWGKVGGEAGRGGGGEGRR